MGYKIGNYFFFNSFFMADHKQFYRSEYKQLHSSGMAIHNIIGNVSIPYIQRVFKMAQVKLVWLICDIFGIPITLLGIAANLNNVKSTILFIIAAIYLMLRAYYYGVRQQQEAKAREIDNWHKEQDKLDRINKNK